MLSSPNSFLVGGRRISVCNHGGALYDPAFATLGSEVAAVGGSFPSDREDHTLERFPFLDRRSGYRELVHEQARCTSFTYELEKQSRRLANEVGWCGGFP